MGWIPRVACFARNPGLGNRNTYRVAAACVSLSPNPPKGREFYIKPHSNPPKAPSRGWSYNGGPIPAFFKVKELQLLAYPCLLQGEGVPTEAPPDLSQGEGVPTAGPIPAFFKVKGFQQKPLLTFHKGKERHPSALNTVRWDSRPLGRVWGGASVEGDSGAIAPGYTSGRLLAHDKLEGATCHDVGVGDVVLLILLAVELDRLDVAVVGAAAVGLHGEGLAVGEGDVCAA